MKKSFALFLALVILCSLAACSAQDDAPSGSTSQEGRSQEQAQQPDDTPTPAQPSPSAAVSPVPLEFDASLSWANWSEDPKVMELALNKETFALSSARHIPIYKCDTLNELNEFKETFAETFTMDLGWDEVPSFNEVSAHCTEDFFAENALLLVYVTEGSCTPRFGVDSVSEENGTLLVTVKKTYDPEEGDCAMAGWLFTVAVAKDRMADCTVFDAVLQ